MLVRVFVRWYNGPGLRSQVRRRPARVHKVKPVSPPPVLSFEEIGISSTLSGALREEFSLEIPTDIQRRVIPELSNGKDILFAEQTGTGKTLAYVLPMMENIRKLEAASGLMAVPNRPRGLIIVPSRELAVQVGGVVKKLSHHFKLASRTLLGGSRISMQKTGLESSVDLVVATPGRLRRLVESGSFRLTDISMTVIDEADTMFDRDCGFIEDLQAGCFAPMQRNSKPSQMVLVCATIQQQAIRYLRSMFPKLQTVMGKSLHTAPLAMKVDFIDISIRDKQNVLMDTVELILSKSTPGTAAGSIIVFCNTIDSCRAADHFLREADLATSCVSVHGGILPKSRAANFELFLSNQASILVTTDISCRGLDLSFARNIILFDFPLNTVDFIHRAGRTARAGQSGTVTALVSRRDRSLAHAIRAAIQSGQSIEGLQR